MAQIVKACSRCGAHPAACRCPARPARSSWSPWRDRAEQARFRRALLERFGGRCAYVFAGERCIRTERLQAHHGKNGTPDLLLCEEHHAVVDPHARVTR